MGTLDERLSKSCANTTRPVDVGFEGDALFRMPNSLEHGREYLATVVERGDLVSGYQRRTKEDARGSRKSRVVDGIERRERLFGLVFPEKTLMAMTTIKAVATAEMPATSRVRRDVALEPAILAIVLFS